MLILPLEQIHFVFHIGEKRIAEINIVVDRDEHILDCALRDAVEIAGREEVDAFVTVDRICECFIAGIPLNFVILDLALITIVEDFQLDRRGFTGRIRVDIPVCHPFDCFIRELAGQAFVARGNLCNLFRGCGIQRLLDFCLLAASGKGTAGHCGKEHCSNCKSRSSHLTVPPVHK